MFERLDCPERQFVNWLKAACWMLIFALGGVQPISGQQTASLKDVDEPGLTAEVAVGWGGVVDRRVPIVLAFQFRNDQERDIKAVLTVTEKFTGRQIQLGEIVIAAGSSRRVTSIQALNNWEDAIATLRQSDKVIWRREAAIATGVSYDADSNYLLCIDQGGRKFQIPNEQDSTPKQNQRGQRLVAGSDGRKVRCITAKPWQLPNHPGPFVAVQSLVFVEGISEKDLNQVQWAAISEWICQGGIAFLPATSGDAISRLISSSPLIPEPATTSGSFTTRRCGLGAIHEYSDQLMTSKGDALRGEVGRVTSHIARNHINSFADTNYFYTPGRTSTQSTKYSLLIVGLFSVYTLLSGLVTLFLFRLNPRRIAIYITVVVVSTSVGAAVLGGVLQAAKGDLQLLTITQPGTGGLIQVGAVDLQSAGGRKANIAIQGDHADIQAIARGINVNNYWMHQATGYSPFTWQPTLDPTAKNSYQIQVAMSPWSRRRCHATAFRQVAGGIEAQLEFDLQGTQIKSDQGADSLLIPQGRFKLSINNRFPFKIQNCWLVIGTTTEIDETTKKQNATARRSGQVFQQGQSATANEDGLIDIYQVHELKTLESLNEKQFDFDASFQNRENHWQISQFWPHNSEIPPRISELTKNQAWIVGSLTDSPIIQIDTDQTDFIPAEKSIHLFIYELPSDELPDSLKFKRSAISTTDQPADATKPENN